MRATPPSATRSRACWRTPGGRWSASTTSTTPAARWTGSARRWRRVTSSSLGRDGRVPEDGYHGAYVVRARPATSSQTEGPGSPTCRPTSGSRRLRDGGRAGASSWIDATLERFGVRFDVYLSERLLAETGEIETAIEPAARRAATSTRPRARCGSAPPTFGDDKDRVVDPLERCAHVLRRRLRVRRSTSSRAGSTT